MKAKINNLDKLEKRFIELQHGKEYARLDQIDALLHDALDTCWPHDNCMKFIDRVLEYRTVMKYAIEYGFASNDLPDTTEIKVIKK